MREKLYSKTECDELMVWPYVGEVSHDTPPPGLQLPLFNSSTIEIPHFVIDRYLDSPMKNSAGANNTFHIQSRRYLGNKFKLLSLIRKIVEERCKPYRNFCDIFAGTGVTGEHFNEKDIKIISNELLYSNYISLYAWLSPESFDGGKIKEYINMLNSLSCDGENYFSINYGGTYFTYENARKIGAIREKIEQMKLSFKERSILLTSLLYAVDKAANTCGHYDAFRKKLDTTTPIKLLIPDINQEKNCNNEIYNKDANVLIENLECDILYIEPPDNSRQYCDAYHLLENLICWNKGVVYGKAKKMDRSNLKSQYCLKSAGKVFSDLINKAKCKHILVSYNNTGESKDGRSNARIKDGEIIRILEEKGKVEIFEQHYKAFTTGKSATDGHTERVFYCKVRK